MRLKAVTFGPSVYLKWLSQRQIGIWGHSLHVGALSLFLGPYALVARARGSTLTPGSVALGFWPCFSCAGIGPPRTLGCFCVLCGGLWNHVVTDTAISLYCICCQLYGKYDGKNSTWIIMASNGIQDCRKNLIISIWTVYLHTCSTAAVLQHTSEPGFWMYAPRLEDPFELALSKILEEKSGMG